jgi:hypothetical protein
MSNCAPVLVVDGAAVEEAPGDVDGTVLLFFGPQPAIANTATADSVRTAAAATGRDEPSVLCARMTLTTPRD